MRRISPASAGMSTIHVWSGIEAISATMCRRWGPVPRHPVLTMHLISVDPDSTFGDRRSIQPEVSNSASIRVMVLAARREPIGRATRCIRGLTRHRIDHSASPPRLPNAPHTVPRANGSPETACRPRYRAPESLGLTAGRRAVPRRSASGDTERARTPSPAECRPPAPRAEMTMGNAWLG